MAAINQLIDDRRWKHISEISYKQITVMRMEDVNSYDDFSSGLYEVKKLTLCLVRKFSLVKLRQACLLHNVEIMSIYHIGSLIGYFSENETQILMQSWPIPTKGVIVPVL